MPGGDEILAAFTELAPRYEQTVDDELRRFWGWSYEGFADWLLALAAIRDGDDILDLATGTAFLPRKLTAPTHGRIVGLDLTPAMLDYARAKLAESAAFARVQLVCGSALALPFAAGSFDLVLCALGVHHLAARPLVTEIRRVLRPGGALVLADAAAAPIWRFPAIRAIMRALAFLYFLPAQGAARASVEASAAAHIHTIIEWRAIMAESGLDSTRVHRPPNRRRGLVFPFAVRAIRPSNDC